MEVEAVDEGTLAKIVVPEGTADVPVNDIIGVIASEGEDAKAVAAAGAPGEAKAPAPVAAGETKVAEGAASSPAAERARAADAPAPVAHNGERGFRFPLGAPNRQGCRDRSDAPPGIGAARPDRGA